MTGLTYSAMEELLRGVQRLGEHSFRVALYDARAILDLETRVYSPEFEVTGSGYTAGGKLLSNITIKRAGSQVQATWAPVVWQETSLTAHHALIYNVTLPGLPALCALSFNPELIAVNGPLTITFPEDFIVLI